MDEGTNRLMEGIREESEARAQALQRVLAGADSARVFGQAVTAGDYTVIPVAEVASGGGFGSGMGFGTPRMRRRMKGQDPAGTAEGGESTGEGTAIDVEGGGGGGGGGGGAMGRPVAVIVLGPDGVSVKPVLDLTKLAITALGAWGAVAALSVKIWAKR